MVNQDSNSKESKELPIENAPEKIAKDMEEKIAERLAEIQKAADSEIKPQIAEEKRQNLQKKRPGLQNPQETETKSAKPPVKGGGKKAGAETAPEAEAKEAPKASPEKTVPQTTSPGTEATPDTGPPPSTADTQKQNEMAYQQELARMQTMAIKEQEYQSQSQQEEEQNQQESQDQTQEQLEQSGQAKPKKGKGMVGGMVDRAAGDAAQKAGIDPQQLKEKAGGAIGQLLTGKILNFCIVYSWTILPIIYIWIHFICKYIANNKYFCKFGDEWDPKKLATSLMSNDDSKSNPLFTTNALGWLEIVALFIVTALIIIIIFLLIDYAYDQLSWYIKAYFWIVEKF